MIQAVAAPPKAKNTPRTMKAALLRAPQQFEIVEAPVPTPGAGEVRVRLEGCGVCASNIPPWEGREWFKYPFEPGQMGHEGWGWIDAVGEGVSGLAVGQRVAMLSNHAYAEYDVAKAEEVVCLPSVLDGQPFPAEPLACAMNVALRSHVHGCNTVAIVGIGFLGAILTRLVSSVGPRVIAITRRPSALELARRMGASETIEMDDHGRIIEKVKELTGGRLCEVVIEAVGKQWPIDLAGELTAIRGRLVIAGYHQDGARQCNLQLWNWRGLDVINAHERDPKVYISGMQAAIEAVASGRLDPRPLYTHKLPLEKLSEALAMTRDRPEGFMKALITI